MTREQEFKKIAERWDIGIRHCSVWHMMAKHPDHALLVSFGQKAVPWVLQRIADGDYSYHWSMLLAELSGTHPDYEPEVDGGFVKWNDKAAAEAWLRLGIEHGWEK